MPPIDPAAPKADAKKTQAETPAAPQPAAEPAPAPKPNETPEPQPEPATAAEAGAEGAAQDQIDVIFDDWFAGFNDSALSRNPELWSLVQGRLPELKTAVRAVPTV